MTVAIITEFCGLCKGRHKLFYQEEGKMGKGGRGNPAPTRFGWVWVGALLAAPFFQERGRAEGEEGEGRGKRRPYDEGRF